VAAGATLVGSRERTLRIVALLALFALALAVRWHYTSVVVPAAGVSGDEQAYGFYGVHLVRDGVYSGSPLDSAPVPDSFRSPGLPLLIAFTMQARGLSDLGWYSLLQRIQCVLGALTAVLLVLFARRWLPWWPAFGVGVVTALWPHGIAMTAHALVEVLYGFTLALAAVAFARALARGRSGEYALAGLALSLAAMVNPVVLAVLPALAIVAALRSRRGALAFLALTFALPLAWSLRDTADVPGASSGGRAAMNLVVGSWPNYHADWFATRANGDAAATQRLARMDAEVAAAPGDLGAAIAAVGARFAADPSGMAAWYFIRKPWLLWDWGIRIGQGDLQVVALTYSPFVAEPAYRALAAIAHAMNPLLFALALCSLPLALRLRAARQDAGCAAFMACAGIVVSITAVHVLLQAEPRYSIALRGFEIALAATALERGWRWLAARRAAQANEVPA